jgi:hypothetical protein
MNPKNITFLIFILGSLFFSGCLKEEGSVTITSTDVMYSQEGDGTRLTIIPYIRNDMGVDTGILSIKVNIKEPSTNLIVATKDSDIGYIKSKNSASNSVSLKVTDPGEYSVEVQVFEGSKLMAQSYTQVTIKEKPAQGQSSDIKLTDMNLVITKLLNDASMAVIEISPGLYNQGGDSKPLTIEVTAQIDPYNTYVQSDSINVVTSTNRVRSKVTFTIPRNKEFSISVKVLENGREVALAKVPDKIKLNTIKYNEPKNYILVEEGKPVAMETAKPAAAATPKEPGFQGFTALMGLLAMYCIMKRTGRLNK